LFSSGAKRKKEKRGLNSEHSPEEARRKYRPIKLGEQNR
jgi:hypothetical protein